MHNMHMMGNVGQGYRFGNGMMGRQMVHGGQMVHPGTVYVMNNQGQIHFLGKILFIIWRKKRTINRITKF